MVEKGTRAGIQYEGSEDYSERILSFPIDYQADKKLAKVQEMKGQYLLCGSLSSIIKEPMKQKILVKLQPYRMLTRYSINIF